MDRGAKCRQPYFKVQFGLSRVRSRRRQGSHLRVSALAAKSSWVLPASSLLSLHRLYQQLDLQSQPNWLPTAFAGGLFAHLCSAPKIQADEVGAAKFFRRSEAPGHGDTTSLAVSLSDQEALGKGLRPPLSSVCITYESGQYQIALQG